MRCGRKEDDMEKIQNFQKCNSDCVNIQYDNRKNISEFSFKTTNTENKNKDLQ